MASAFLESLHLWLDPTPRPGPENMAIDESLLFHAGQCPVLRVYGWDADWISIGYFQKLSELPASIANVAKVRRWTGGGLVDHRQGCTYTLTLPAAEPVCHEPPARIYERVHQALADTLTAAGAESTLAPCPLDGEPGQCFAGGYARFDVLNQGRKIAGAALRRSRAGYLLQGYVLTCAVPWSDFAGRLSKNVMEWAPDEELERQANDLARERYGGGEWMNRF